MLTGMDNNCPQVYMINILFIHSLAGAVNQLIRIELQTQPIFWCQQKIPLS